MIGEGLGDANLGGDITSVSYDLAIKDAFTGETRTPFDLYFLDNEADYNCYIEKVTKWTEFKVAESCEFVRPGAE